MYIEELKNESEWEDFLRSIPEATFYHTINWKNILEKSFGYTPAYLTIRDEGEIVGICPGFVTTPWSFRIYTSLPHSDYGGPLFSNSHSAKGAILLRELLAKYCAEKGVSYAKINFSGSAPVQFREAPFTYADRSRVIAEIDLKSTQPESVWKALPRTMRQGIGHFEKDGYNLEEVNSEFGLKEFYSLYYSNMMHIGVVPYPYRFFETIWNTLSSREFRMWLIKGKQNLGGIGCFVYGQRLYMTYAAINREFSLSRYPIMPYIFWNVSKWCREHDIRHCSLGSTPADSARFYYRQKLMFGAKFLQQETILVPFNCLSKGLFIIRKEAISAWKTLRDLLPTNLKAFLDSRLFQL
jgi:hypothetical protein